MWPDRRILERFGIELPILQAPMASSTFAEMAIAVSEAGGLGSLPMALLGAPGPGDFGSLWSGQAARLGRALPAGELTRVLAAEALARLGSL